MAMTNDYSKFAGPFDLAPCSVVKRPDKHKQALMVLKELASLRGNPGRTANKLLEIVGELLEID